MEPNPDDVEFYPVSTSYTETDSRGLSALLRGLSPSDYYAHFLSTWSPFSAPLGRDFYASAAIEGTWYDHLQPEYKAYPSIVAALAATKIEIGCEHLKMPFPAFAVRLPVDFVREGDGPAIRCLFVAMLRNELQRHSGARPVTSIESDPAPDARHIPFVVVPPGPLPPDVLMVQAKYIDKDGDDAFANFTIGLERGKTLEQKFDEWVGRPRRAEIARAAAGTYVLSDKMSRELLALAVGISFFATGRHKSPRLFEPDKRQRHQRRQFEREFGGEQPTFNVGRELVLPREEGAQGPPGDHSEGAGVQLRWAHYRTGHLRYQAAGPGRSERRLVFIEPTIVRPDLPLRPRVTPGSVTDERQARDVTRPE